MTIVKSVYRGTKEYDAVRKRLVAAARDRSTVTYKEIAVLMGIHPTGSGMARKVGQVLGEIVEDEQRVGRPMLSCLARRVDTGKPGEGFFILAQQLGLLHEMADNAAREDFLKSQCEATYEVFLR